jgi:major membrane immunogen (membrane-anchored lipoprotein)
MNRESGRMKILPVAAMTALMLLGACGSEPPPEPEPAAENPIERGVAPARARAAEADSLMRERERQMQEAVDGAR